MMAAALGKVFPNKPATEISVGIKGLGKVGLGVVKLLQEKSFNLLAADIDKEAINLAQQFADNLVLVAPEEITTYQLDIYVPCALGNDINEHNASQLRAKLICGGANNQLSSPDVDNILYQNDILYVPDYLANAGGLINVADELEPGGYNHERVIKRIDNLANIFDTLYESAIKQNVSLLQATEQFLAVN
jgi:leucine dehydrogenase